MPSLSKITVRASTNEPDMSQRSEMNQSQNSGFNKVKKATLNSSMVDFGRGDESRLDDRQSDVDRE